MIFTDEIVDDDFKYVGLGRPVSELRKDGEKNDWCKYKIKGKCYKRREYNNMYVLLWVATFVTLIPSLFGLAYYSTVIDK